MSRYYWFLVSRTIYFFIPSVCNDRQYVISGANVFKQKTLKEIMKMCNNVSLIMLWRQQMDSSNNASNL
jgi:hypothetical protein